MEPLLMSAKAIARLTQFARVKAGDISLLQAAAAIPLSYSQAKRSYKKWRKHGNKAMVHGLRGKASNNKPKTRVKAEALAVYRQHYSDFGPTLAAEYLADKHKILVPVNTLRTWAIQSGVWKVGQKPPLPEHRQWRERRPCFGHLVQLDGSDHDWFEGRNPHLPRCVLMVMVDDATSITHAQFFTAEDTEAAYRVFEGWVGRHGVPQELYPDQDSIYKVNREASTDETLRCTGPETQFARAMRELGVVITCAHSPQAKGRVERKNGVFQDRLVKALRIEGISDIGSANRFLNGGFLDKHNAKFSVKARNPADAHRKLGDCLPRGKSLHDVLSWEEQRTVANDWCVQWKNLIFQVMPAHRTLRLARQKVIVREHLDGSMAILYRNKPLQVKRLDARPITPERPATPLPPEQLATGNPSHTPRGKPPYKPSATHPWRGGKEKSSKRGASALY